MNPYQIVTADDWVGKEGAVIVDLSRIGQAAAADSDDSFAQYHGRYFGYGMFRKVTLDASVVWRYRIATGEVQGNSGNIKTPAFVMLEAAGTIAKIAITGA